MTRLFLDTLQKIPRWQMKTHCSISLQLIGKVAPPQRTTPHSFLCSLNSLQFVSSSSPPWVCTSKTQSRQFNLSPGLWFLEHLWRLSLWRSLRISQQIAAFFPSRLSTTWGKEKQMTYAWKLRPACCPGVVTGDTLPRGRDLPRWDRQVREKAHAFCGQCEDRVELNLNHYSF